MVMSFSQLLHRVSIVAVATRLFVPHSATLPAAVAAFTPAISNTLLPTSTRRSFARSTSPLFSSPPTRYLLTYDYIPDVLEKRGPFREGHVGLAKEMIEKGTCVSGGPSAVPGESVPNGGK